MQKTIDVISGFSWYFSAGSFTIPVVAAEVILKTKPFLCSESMRKKVVKLLLSFEKKKQEVVTQKIVILKIITLYSVKKSEINKRPQRLFLE